MSYLIADFESQVRLVGRTFKWYANVATELNAIAAALGTDATAHDKTIEVAPSGLRLGLASNTHFTNAVLRVVNAGKGGNLTPAAMGTAITGGLSQILVPVNTAAPVASGTGAVGDTLSCTTGTWQYSPTSYRYQWFRGGATIAGATASTYLLQAADSGANVSCGVTAINAAGPSASGALSNAIAVA
jgi:hypothetical protein